METSPMSPPENGRKESGVGPMAAIVIVVILLVLGGAYFFITQEMRSQQAPSNQQVNS